MTVGSVGCTAVPESPPSTVALTPAGADREPSVVVPTLSLPEPAHIAIPSIDLTEDLIDLGLTDTGEMEVPSNFDDAGWFTGGGRPGGFGPTVVAGHVDSTTGPAVFDRLPQLRVGATVDVIDDYGALSRYRVESVSDYAKDEFPTAVVFGAVPADEIRLITCSGDFNATVGSYERNVVVFGRRI